MKDKRPAWQSALIEFLVVFVVAVCWNLVRKTDESFVDALGIATLTAVLLYFFAVAKGD